MTKNSQKNIIFIGTPEFGVIVLKKLIEKNYKLVLIITAPDKPAKRKLILTPPPVKVLAQKYNIPILQPEKIEESKSDIEKLKPDLIIVSGYSQILSKKILDMPKFGCLNVHPSLLPKYQGATPIQHAILNGEEKTGASIILMDTGIDTGPVLAQERIKIEETDNSTTLYEKLANLGSDLLIKSIPEWIEDKIKAKEQNQKKATYTKTLKKEDGRIEWKQSAESIERQIRAFHLWPGSFFEIERPEFKFKKVKVTRGSVLEQDKVGPFGIIGKTFLASNSKIAVQTGKDFFIIEELQPEGKKIMTVKEFLNGCSHFVGIILYKP